MVSHFYPRPPRGGRLEEERDRKERELISIHALREEGDGSFRSVTRIRFDFHPRPPRGGRPTLTRTTPPLSRNFYPRPPRGGRLTESFCQKEAQKFLSTPSARRATIFFVQSAAILQFLSTPSARRATSKLCSDKIQLRDFYPRPPRGGRPALRGYRTTICTISIHALREEGD